MTDFNRSILPDAVRSNGATPNPWWANAVVYQIYRRVLFRFFFLVVAGLIAADYHGGHGGHWYL